MERNDLIERLRTLTTEIHGTLPISKFMTLVEAAEALAEAEKKGAEAAATIEALQNPWSNDMESMPHGQNVLVYQPASKTGRTTLPARICELRNAGYIRESTHWMIPAPPRDLSQGGQHG